MLFSEKEFRSSIAKYNNSLTPKSDKLSWKHLKIIVNNILCFKNFINITKYSKLWWNKECNRELERYQASKQVENQRNFRSTIKKTKHKFFNTKIQEIIDKNSSS